MYNLGNLKQFENFKDELVDSCFEYENFVKNLDISTAFYIRTKHWHYSENKIHSRVYPSIDNLSYDFGVFLKNLDEKVKQLLANGIFEDLLKLNPDKVIDKTGTNFKILDKYLNFETK